MGYLPLRLFECLLTYSRPMKCPTAYRATSRTITIGIARDTVLCDPIPAAITAIIEEYMSNGNRCPVSARWGSQQVAVEGLMIRMPDCRGDETDAG